MLQLIDAGCCGVRLRYILLVLVLVLEDETEND
jgi:hypothetical protein